MEDKLYRVVFVFNSGKSIVYTMVEENALKVFSDWKKIKENKEANSFIILEVTKAKEGLISEKLGVDLTKIDAIQVDELSSSSSD